MGPFPPLKRTLVPLALLAIIALSTLPGGIGFSTGAHKGTVPDPAFESDGCTACHGDNSFADGAYDVLSWNITDAEGVPLSGGNAYEHDATYTIGIGLDEQNAPEAGNRAGFNLRASAGTLEGIEGTSQVTDDGTQATHVDASSTQWQVTWTAPAEGVVVFDLFVNDVNGDGAPDAGDEVYRAGWYLLDEEGALPGAAVEEEHFEVGVPLPQYWLGLIALFGMAVIIVFGFVYLKWFSPHHADQKKR